MPRVHQSVAVLSDIHGVLPALEAVLAEPDVRSADRIVLLGDMAAGPQPLEVLGALHGLGRRATWVRGNADSMLVALARGQQIDVPDEIIRWAASQLSPDDVAMFAALPHPVTMTIDGFGSVLCCHGTPRDDNEVVLVDTRMSRWAEVLVGVSPETRTVVCGHTHMQFSRLVDTRLVINAGSVGMPYGRAGAHWALLANGEARLRRTEFDLDEACARISADSTFPGAASWADRYLRARTTDTDAISAFGPRDGRN